MKHSGEGHRMRLRERFLNVGREGLCEHELLELLLFYAIPRRDVKPIAKELLVRFGSIVAVLSATPEQLASVKGIGSNSIVLLKLFQVIGVELFSKPLREGICLKDQKKLKDFLMLKCRDAGGEKLFLLVLNRESKLLDFLEFPGNVNTVTVSKQELLFKLLSCRGARQVIMCHNHLGNNPSPSASDIRSTVELKSFLAGVGISLLDHLIVTDSDCVSMMKHAGER